VCGAAHLPPVREPAGRAQGDGTSPFPALQPLDARLAIEGAPGSGLRSDPQGRSCERRYVSTREPGHLRHGPPHSLSSRRRVLPNAVTCAWITGRGCGARWLLRGCVRKSADERWSGRGKVRIPRRDVRPAIFRGCVFPRSYERSHESSAGGSTRTRSCERGYLCANATDLSGARWAG
jgi:hypothetical protein